jgi:hypothetical protein
VSYPIFLIDCVWFFGLGLFSVAVGMGEADASWGRYNTVQENPFINKSKLRHYLPFFFHK